MTARRRLATLSMVALLATACTDDDSAAPPVPIERAEGETSSTTTTALAEQAAPVPAADAVELSVGGETRMEAGPVTWTIEVEAVANESFTLTFPTSQIGDAVLSQGGEEKYRWSDGQFFTQAVEHRIVPADGELVLEFTGDLTGTEPGLYTLEVSLAVVGPPEPATRRIRVTAPR